MLLLWVMLWWVLCPLARPSEPDRCSVQQKSSLLSESPLLESLKCFNDYQSFVHCSWREDGNSTLQLWFSSDSERQQCLPHDAAEEDGGRRDQNRTVQCRYKTRVFSIGTKHTAFFVQEKTEPLCSSVSHRPLDLPQLLRARAPLLLAVQDAGDGGQRLSWSNPYASSSSLSRSIRYQLSYRTDIHDDWTTEDVTNTSLTLDQSLLLTGLRNEARVRARVSVGQWSHWSPVLMWETEQGTPRLHCVLAGETKVICSWEVSREQAHFITHQLSCRCNRTETFVICCTNPTVTFELSKRVLKYSCSLEDVDPAHLQLELQPTHTVKVFKANHHIRPDPPQRVKVREKGRNWIVEWTGPSTASKLRLYYQLCYYRTQEKRCSILDLGEGSMSLMILEDSLVPTQNYQVKVRSLVAPAEDSIYRGIPSEWTDPVDWTSHEASWSLNNLIYVFIALFVTTVFIALYCSIPACQRKINLWTDSVPSPRKSKMLLEIKSTNSWALVQTENPSMCRVQHFSRTSTGSRAPLWPNKESEKNSLDQGDGCLGCDNQTSRAKEASSCDTSSMSFSGPYILCQVPESKFPTGDIKGEHHKDRKTLSHDSKLSLSVYGTDYVYLPTEKFSRSTQYLMAQSDTDTNTPDSMEQTQCPDGNADVQQGVGDPSSGHQPQDDGSGTLSFWPQGGTTGASGYCQLPRAHSGAEN